MAGYLVWTGMVPSESQAVVVVEKMTERPIGSLGRRMVTIAGALPKPGDRRSGTQQPDEPGEAPAVDG